MNRIDPAFVDNNLALGEQSAKSLGYRLHDLPPSLRSPLLRSLTLRFLRTNVGILGEQGVPDADLFYDEYHWILTFAGLSKQEHGEDAGIEQEVFKVLENAPEGVDWNEIEKITLEVEQRFGEPFFPEH